MSRTSLSAVALTLSLGAISIATTSLAPTQDMPESAAQHRKLLQAVGQWEGEMTVFIPGMDAQVSSAKETVRAVGSLWTSARFECDMMGMPFIGIGILGYDQEKEKYVGTWVDSMRGTITLMEGTEAEDGTLTMRWEAVNPMTGENEPNWYDLKYSKREYTSTFYSGEGTKGMEVKMKRKNAGKGKAKAKGKAKKKEAADK